MDIENMHPFCLPFGFCHDATSSSIAADFAPVHNNNNNDSTSNDNINNNNNNKDKIRSKTSSPVDDLFRHFNCATSSAISQSLLNDDILIGSSSSSSLDINTDESFYSLGLDINIDADTSNQDTGIDIGLTTDEDQEGDLKDDWYCNQYSLFSPTSAHHTTRRKSLIRTALLTGTNNQVFQHVVDSIDIKSSPTLAQLNLNSNDDPADGFWDTTTSSISANTDLLSNSTSVGIIHGSNSNNNNSNVTCNHLHNHHHNAPTYSHLNNVSSSPSCHHIHHHHHNQQQNRYASSINSTQSTCLAVTPFRRPTDLQQYPTCCHSLLTTTNSSSNNGSNLRPSATLNQLNQLGHPVNSSAIRHLANIENDHNQKPNQQQRSASPALVTSSSSPLSSTLNTANENRLNDNKLKENIEYLTALLCNGNKLENNNQQPPSTISSTMAKSYATLAHSLSTGPKLFERQQITLALNAHQKSFNQNQQAITCNPTNEAAPCIESTHQYNSQNSNSLKRPYSETWFKPAVESSVSAADSTECQISGLSNNQATHNLSPCSSYQSVSNNNNQTITDQRTQKSSELKVLSSLLNTNKCATSCSTNSTNPNISNQTQGCEKWQDRSTIWNQSQTIQPAKVELPQVPVSSPHEQKLPASTTIQEQTSIPPNGKPITLTPITSHTNLAINQVQKAPKASLFVQPASPSASSTTSSGGNTDIISVSTPSAKKQKSGYQQQLINQKGSNRSARPNSMSTDCSLSSHDEGFSSQVDNDDCGSNRDSDDDDDVDSDDESFYGDYTNSDLIGASISDNSENKWTLNMGRTRRNGQKRYFWQYNVQSKGPKGTRICSTDDSEDPFVLPEASDPVFSNECQVEGVKHSGKARRGDGNDLTPNPKKLLMIGLELKKLGKIINDLAPVTDLPVNARNKTRKEKNKLASRACRLKKKAQHEANKIKLYGLQREHQQVVLAIYDIRKLLNATMLKREAKGDQQQQVANGKESIENDNGNSNSSAKAIAEQCSMKVAGQTSDYVNSILEKVVSGCIDGGLQT